MEKARNIMIELRDLPGQAGRWNSILESDEWLTNASSNISFITAAERIKTRFPQCGETKREDCAGFHYRVDVNTSITTKALTIESYVCTVGLGIGAVEGDTETTMAYISTLKDIGINSAKANDWKLHSILFPKSKPLQLELLSVRNGCREYAEKLPDTWLYLWSHRNGVGKTRLAVGTALDISLLHGIPGRLVNVPLLFNEYKAMLASRTDIHGEEDDFAGMAAFEIVPALSKYEGCLILDDIGKDYPTTRMMEMLYVIINERYLHGLPMIFTSNRDFPDELIAHWGMVGEGYADAIISRMFEKCKIHSLNQQVDFRRIRNG